MTRPPRRMVLSDVSSGTKGILSEFEKAVRTHEMVGSRMPDERPVVEQHYISAKQKLLRKLYRLENGVNISDVERLKRDFKRLAKGYIEAVSSGKDSHELWVMALAITEGKHKL